MLSLSLLFYILTIPLFSYIISASLFNRISSIILLYSGILSLSTFSNYDSISSGIQLYNGLFQVTTISLSMEIFLLIIGCFLLLSWAPIYITNYNAIVRIPTISEYALIILCTTIGSCLLLSSSDLVSMFLSIELQSFSVYILATLYRNSESATSAGLKYFLLGGLSSCILLLGTCILYSYTGLTQFENIYTLLVCLDSSWSISPSYNYSYSNSIISIAILLSLILIAIGFMFKIASAPFHNWAPDVYDGVPTIVTSWLSTMPKIAIFIFLLELAIGIQGANTITTSLLNIFTEEYTSVNIWKNLLLCMSLLSLVTGTLVGLSQTRIKRLLAYSTISHVGFLLLSLAIMTQESVESFLFYIIQYSITNVNTFLIILAFQYIIYNRKASKINKSEDISAINEIKGESVANPILSTSLALSLFSMAGIPPLIGFFAKQMVLYSSIHNGYYFISIIAILVSVISASYYLKIVKVMYFSVSSITTNKIESKSNSVHSNNNENYIYVTTMHTTIISILTTIIVLFIFEPSLLLNICEIISLSIFYY